MKTTRVFWAAALAVLLGASCAKDDKFQETPKEQNTDKKTIIVGGEPLYAGYGYDPSEDRAFRNAIDPAYVYESTDIQPAVGVLVSKVSSKEELEEHAKGTYSVTRKKKKFFGLVKSSHTTTRTLETYVKINEESVSVIAKVKVQSQRFYTDATPKLIPLAQRLLEQKKYAQFLDNYGHFYVDSRTVGGEVQYVYNYSYCKIDRWSRATFAQKAKGSILGIFGKSSSVNLTDEDRLLLEQSQESVHMLSSVPGYAPKMIHTIEDANAETENLQAYLQEHPEKATTIEMDLKPYSELIADEAFGQMSLEKEECLKLVEAYEKHYDRLHFVYQNASDPAKRQEAYNDMQVNREQLQNLNCGQAAPSFDAIFEQKYGDVLYGKPCGNYSSDFKIQIRVSDLYPGGEARMQSTALANVWSHWIGDANLYDPDFLQVGLALDANAPTKLVDTDFRIAIQIADAQGSSEHGVVRYTPWASEGGGWSAWANDANDYNFDVVRVMLQTRPKKDFFIDNLRIGIQTYDKNRSPYTSPEMYSPWMRDGGGLSGYAGHDNFEGMDRVRIKLDINNRNDQQIPNKVIARPNDKTLYGDVNGDGKDELVFISSNSNTTAIYVTNAISGETTQVVNHVGTSFNGWLDSSDKMFVGDVNGDQKEDLVLVNTMYRDGAIRAIDLTTGKNITWVNHSGSGFGGWMDASDKMFLGDVNGDQREDLVLINTDYNGGAIRSVDIMSGSTIKWIDHNGGGFDGWMDSSDRVFLGDVNADNRDDLVLVNSDYRGGAIRAVNLTTGATLKWIDHNGNGFGGWMDSSDRMVLGDVNGDQKDDLVLVNTDYNGGAIRSIDILSGGTIKWIDHNGNGFGGWMDSSDKLFLGDVDSDNKEDLVLVNTDYSGGAIRTVNLLSGKNLKWIDHGSFGGWMDSSDRMFLSDVNGDEKKDLVLVNTDYNGGTIRSVDILSGGTI